MGGARMAVYALLLLVFLAIADWGLHHGNDTSAVDAELVYCLAPAHLGGLVNAAEALGLASPAPSPTALLAGGRTLSVEQWRTVDKADFQRACDAYATANMPSSPAAEPSGSGLQTVADVLLPVIAGALLTMAADDFKQAADRRWALADELRGRWADFAEAGRVFSAACAQPLPAGLTSTDNLDAKRRRLQETVQKIRLQYPLRPKIRNLQRDLERDPLGPSMRESWDTDITGKQQRASEIGDRLDTYGAAIEETAGAMERRIWLPSKR